MLLKQAYDPVIELSSGESTVVDPMFLYSCSWIQIV